MSDSIEASNELTLQVVGKAKGVETVFTIPPVNLSNVDNKDNKPTKLISEAMKLVSNALERQRLTDCHVVVTFRQRKASFAVRPSDPFSRRNRMVYVSLSSLLFPENAYEYNTTKHQEPLAVLIARIFGLKSENGVSFLEFRTAIKFKFDEVETMEKIQEIQAQRELLENSPLPQLLAELKNVRKAFKERLAELQALPASTTA